MRALSNKSRSNNNGEISSEDGDSGESSEDYQWQDDYQSTIKKANKASLGDIFIHYNVNCSVSNKKARCPFPFHKSGKESTASFYYYPDTNTFWCFGCKTGTTPCDFVSKIEDVSKIEAANKIISNTFDKVVFSLDGYSDNSVCKDTIIEFSNFIRNKMYTYPHRLDKIDSICKSYDVLFYKYKLVNNYEGLSALIVKVKQMIEGVL